MQQKEYFPLTLIDVFCKNSIVKDLILYIYPVAANIYLNRQLGYFRM